MDVVTQITLGAAVGQATMHRSLGNKAVAWGALGGLLPDLDVLAYPLMNEITQLTWHRGISHGVPLMFLLAPLLGWLISRVHRGEVEKGRAMLFVFLALATHVLIDAFTVYGTGVFEPFSTHRVAFNNLFIIDPLYTVPLLLGVLASMLPGEVRARLFRNAIGLTLSSAYVVVTLLLKFATLPAFERALEQQGIAYTRLSTAPTAFNSLLWRGVAEDADGYWIGYRSVFDDSNAMSFWRVPRNRHLLDGMENERAVQTLLWFSDGWYTVSRVEGKTYFHDLRFGEFDVSKAENSFGMGNPVRLGYVFTFALEDRGGATPERYGIRQSDFEIQQFGTMMNTLWERIWR
ncbi:MAG TPA: metal-dependent hydrolase [Bacteroidota bacterium]|nr:metal-dependent hydrolase [Bacteroidota bacterium]